MSRVAYVAPPTRGVRQELPRHKSAALALLGLSKREEWRRPIVFYDLSPFGRGILNRRRTIRLRFRRKHFQFLNGAHFVDDALKEALDGLWRKRALVVGNHILKHLVFPFGFVDR